jgi:ribose transport system substrate-binding protein
MQIKSRRRGDTGSIPKTAIGLCVVIAFGVLALGCEQRPERPQIVAIPSHNERALLNERVGFEETAARNNIGVFWNGPSNWDVERQIDSLEFAIQSHSYGIAVNPVSLFAINTTIDAALSAKIPVVILLDSVYIASSPHLYYVLENQKASAELVAHRLNELINGSGEIALLGGDPLFPGGVERRQDLEDELRRHYPNLHIDDHPAGQVGLGYLEIGAEQLLHEHPDLNAIVALNVTSGLAAYSAIRNEHAQKRVHLLVYDQSDELTILLRRGEIDSIVVQDMRRMGSQAVEDIVADRQGKEVQQTVYVEPKLVTRENIDDEAVQLDLQMNLPMR